MRFDGVVLCCEMSISFIAQTCEIVNVLNVLC